MRLDDLIGLPTSTWRLQAEDDASRSWFGATGVAIRAFCLDGVGPVSMDLAQARAHYEAESSAFGGVILDLEAGDTAAGPVVRSVFKYRLPQFGPGMYYVGILLLVFEDAHVRIHTEAVEGSPTGSREVVVMMAEPDAWPELELREGPPEPGEVEARNLPSDDPRWDDTLPDHPLSRVRAQQREILEGLTLAQ